MVSISRFNFVYNQVALWLGPLSVVISVKDRELPILSALIAQAQFPSRVYVNQYVNNNELFPINVLRNMAYSLAVTSHVLISDIDVVPAPSLYTTLLSLPPEIQEDDKLALVLPLFEMTHYNAPCSNWYLCHTQMSNFFEITKYDLRMCILTKACTDLGSTGANQYVLKSWYSLPSSNHSTPYSCWANTQQQPFLVVRKSPNVPSFFESFEGFGKNRLEWINHLRLRGFHFRLLSHSWLYHLRHRPYTNYDEKHDQNTLLFNLREYELNSNHTGEWRLPLCNNAQEVYSNPSKITVQQFLKQKVMEEKRRRSPVLEKDRAILEKFARRRKQKKYGCLLEQR